MIEKYTNYAKAFNADQKTLTWINSNLKTNLTKNQENQDEIEHIIDYLISGKAPKRIHKMSYNEAKANTEKWNNALIRKGKKIIEDENDTELIKDFNDGFKIVKLVGEKAYEREGFLMRHCVSSYFGKDTEIYSLRDKENIPHCTMEKDQQIKGKGNGSISPKYIKYVVAFLEETGMRVGDNEMKNLGYFNASKIKEYLHNNTEYFHEVYLFDKEKLTDKDGEEFASLELLDVKPLIVETESSLKINFELPKFLKLSIDFMAKNMTAKHTAQNASSGDYAKNASSGHSAKNASSGDYAQNASSGDYAQESVMGKNSVCAAIGKNSKVKASLGTWIVLAEYNNYGIVEFVKSAKIDGDKLKENVWYQLVGGEFKEIEEEA